MINEDDDWHTANKKTNIEIEFIMNWLILLSHSHSHKNNRKTVLVKNDDGDSKQEVMDIGAEYKFIYNTYFPIKNCHCSLYKKKNEKNSTISRSQTNKIGFADAF